MDNLYKNPELCETAESIKSDNRIKIQRNIAKYTLAVFSLLRLIDMLMKK